MTPLHMNCDEFEAALADYLDDSAPGNVRDAIESHADVCSACGPLLGDIERIRLQARELEPLVPSRDLWAGIESRLATRVLAIDSERSVQDIPKRRTWFVPALAAASLVVATATITHYATRASLAPASAVTVATVQPSPVTAQPDRVPAATETPSVVAATAETPAPVTRRLRASEASARFVRAEPAMHSAEPVMNSEIVKLRAIVRERRHQLDPKTVEVLERSIAVIDSAIQQSRAALQRDPASGFLATQLARSLEVKVELLRTAASLPART